MKPLLTGPLSPVDASRPQGEILIVGFVLVNFGT